MFDKSLNSFVDLLELLLVLDTGLFQRGSDGWSLGMSVLIGLILHFDRDVSFLEVRLGCIVQLVLVISQTRQFEQIVLQNLGSFLLHVDLFSAPVAKVAKVNPQFGLGIFVLTENTVTVRAREAKLAFIIFD